MVKSAYPVCEKYWYYKIQCHFGIHQLELEIVYNSSTGSTQLDFGNIHASVNFTNIWSDNGLYPTPIKSHEIFHDINLPHWGPNKISTISDDIVIMKSFLPYLCLLLIKSSLFVYSGLFQKISVDDTRTMVELMSCH